MPPGGRMYELEDADSILYASVVIPKNKVQCAEALGVVDGSASSLELGEPCRRIRVTVDANVSDTHGVWFTWGSDYTGRAGGRVMVTVGAPLDIVLEDPEDHFYVRRVRSSGTVNVAIMGVY